jgi:hypothetical protein
MHLIFVQLPFCDLDPIRLSRKLETDDFALGYVFGLADMGNYQFNRGATGQEAALSYIRHVFTEALGGGGEANFTRALHVQGVPEFAAGRDKGAEELGRWIKSKGQFAPLGLSSHFCED